MSQSERTGQHDPRQRYYELTVAEVVRETQDASSYVFDVPDELASLFEYRPGQFLTFLIPWDDFEIKRCYSLSSTPGWDAKPKVTVKRVDDGRMSNWMNDRLCRGDRIRVMPPAGHFVLNEHAGDRPLVLLGGGSGITPIISILKAALATTQRRIKMIYANRDADSIIFAEELRSLAEAHADRLELHHHLDSDGGFLTVERLRALFAGWLDADFYLCGPTPFMDAIETALGQEALAGGAVHVERFVSAVDPDRAEPEAAAPVAEGVPARIVVHLDGREHEVDYDEGETLLAAAIRAGLDVPFSCQEGFCACCMSRLKQGRVHMPHHEALNEKEIAAGWILACQAKPTTAVCEIEFEDA